MRYLCVYRPGTPEFNAPPTQQEMEAMGKLIGEMPEPYLTRVRHFLDTIASRTTPAPKRFAG